MNPTPQPTKRENREIKITKENFDKVVSNIVIRDRIYNHSWKSWDNFNSLNIKAPTNNKEFGIITKNLYGVKLSVDCLAYSLFPFGKNHKYGCKYEIRELQNDYSKGEIYQLWEKKFSQYDGLKILLNLTFGVLTCGGVAEHHYGQTRCNKKTWERIKNWDNTPNEIKIIKEQQHQYNLLKSL